MCLYVIEDSLKDCYRVRGSNSLENEWCDLQRNIEVLNVIEAMYKSASSRQRLDCKLLHIERGVFKIAIYRFNILTIYIKNERLLSPFFPPFVSCL